MISCDEVLERIAFYLDDELRDGEQAAVEIHVEGCKSCRDALNQQRRVVDVVRDSRPLYEATPALRAGVEKILRDSPAPLAASPALRRRIQRSLGENRWGARRVAAAAAVVVFLALGAA